MRSFVVFRLFIIATKIGENTADKARAMERIIDSVDIFKSPFFILGHGSGLYINYRWENMERQEILERKRLSPNNDE